MTVNLEGLVRHLSLADDRPFALLSQQASPTAARLAREFPERLHCLFSAEHGWFGLAAPGEKTEGETHPRWHIPVHSLYGAHRRPTPETLDGVGRIVVDLQDLGVRCYTYLATLKNVLEAAAEAKCAVSVLDRPIPLGGVVDGPLRELTHASFVAPLNVPLCHGMTPGECARYIDRLENLGLDLTVMKVKDWNHANRAPWPNFIPPSPGIKSWDSAALYPATVFTEAYPAIDCDRDGPLAFRVVGAPWLDADELLDHVAEALFACGMGARAYRYRPSGGAYAGQTVDGLLLTVETPAAFYPVTAGAVLLGAILAHHPNECAAGARPEWLDKLTGSPELAAAYRNDTLGDLFGRWLADQDEYLPTRVNLYPEESTK